MTDMKDRVVLVTTTFTKDPENDIRAKLALRSCEAAAESTYPLIVVDGSGIGHPFQNLMRQRGANVIDQVGKGMGASRRECLRAGLATGADIIVWLEPEKHSIVLLLEACIDLVKYGTFDVVIPRRKSMMSYPKYQAWSEMEANLQLHGITGLPLDYYIGPRVMNRQTAELMADYQPNPELGYGDNWEILFLPLLHMMQKGLTIGSYTVEYTHPEEQRVEDDQAMRDKRDKQRNDLVTAMGREAKRLGIRGLPGYVNAY